MTTTLELLSEAARLTASLESPEGADPEELLPDLAAWLDASGDKLGACWAVTRRFDADEGLLTAILESVTRKLRAVRGQRDRVRDLASELLRTREDLGEDSRVKRPEFSAWLASTTRVDIAPDAVLPEGYRHPPRPGEPDKATLKRVLEGGTPVPGCALVVTRSIRWRS